MKKFLYIGMALIMAVSLAACGANGSTKATTKTSATINVKTIYTKEFKYFPAYSAVKATSFTAATKKSPFGIARYTIKNTTDTKAYSGYESILKKDGWKITQNNKNISISSKKGSHIGDVLFQKAGKDIILVVVSK